MITCYIATPAGLEKRSVNHATALDPKAVWVDLFNPTQQERQWVEEIYGHEPLFPEEMGEIEASARYYQDEAGLHAHIYFLKQEDDGRYRNSSIVFTLQEGTLLSLRLDDFKELHGAYLQFKTLVSPAPVQTGPIDPAVPPTTTRSAPLRGSVHEAGAPPPRRSTFVQ